MRRQTKAQREAARLAAVLQRVEDIYAGAMGETETDPECWVPDLAAILRIMLAMQSRFGWSPDSFMFQRHFLVDYDSPKRLAETIVRHDLDLPRKEPTNG